MTLEGSKHVKHGIISKPSIGEWGRSEFAIYGTTCSEVSALVETIRNCFPSHSIAYLDAHHNDSGQDQSYQGVQCTVHDDHISLLSNSFDNKYKSKIVFLDNSLVVVNGNHFRAASQIVVCNTEKEKSLRKRIDELTNVQLIVLPAVIKSIPKYIVEIFGDKLHDIPVIQIGDIQSLMTFIKTNYLDPPPLNALILAGGRSTRMGADKSLLNYHGSEQIHHLKNITVSLGIKTFFSCRAEQADAIDASGEMIIEDRLINMGPLGGIISAFMFAPDSAWLVLACDLPLLDKNGIEYLISNRNSGAQATAFLSANDNFPEPLAAIWEPSSYSAMLNFLAIGYSCPRKVLINSRTQLLELPNNDLLNNVNTPEELESTKNLLNLRKM